MTQTVIKIGNSQGIIIPKVILKKLKVTHGDILNVDLEDNDKIIISKKTIKKTKPVVSSEFLSWLEAFNKRYKIALAELASK